MCSLYKVISCFFSILVLSLCVICKVEGYIFAKKSTFTVKTTIQHSLTILCMKRSGVLLVQSRRLLCITIIDGYHIQTNISFMGFKLWIKSRSCPNGFGKVIMKGLRPFHSLKTFCIQLCMWRRGGLWTPCWVQSRALVGVVKKCEEV